MLTNKKSYASQVHQDASGSYHAMAESNIRTVAVNFDVIDVSIDMENEVLRAFTETLFSELVLSVEMSGGKLSINVDDLHHFHQSCIAARVEWVNRNRPLFHPLERIVVPKLLYAAITNIGRAVDVELGIELLPRVADTFEPIAFESLLKVSRALQSFSRYGLAFSEGYPKERQTSLDLMAMTHKDGYVVRHDNGAHSVFALLASLLGTTGVERCLYPRVSYGQISHMKSLVSQISHLKGVSQ